MPIVFRNQKAEPVVIEKDGTLFFFTVTPGIRRQARLNMLASGHFDSGELLDDLFKKALTGWENLQDADGNDVPFSPVVRDMLLEENDLFDDEDIFKVFGMGKEKKTLPPKTKK